MNESWTALHLFSQRAYGRPRAPVDACVYVASCPLGHVAMTLQVISHNHVGLGSQNHYRLSPYMTAALWNIVSGQVLSLPLPFRKSCLRIVRVYYCR
jgi:hypothetical protein